MKIKEKRNQFELEKVCEVEVGCRLIKKEDNMLFENNDGYPKDKSYLECGLPGFLITSLEAMKIGLEKVAGGEKYYRLDCDYCALQSDINNAEVNGIISEEQAWYLREKYLDLSRSDNT